MSKEFEQYQKAANNTALTATKAARAASEAADLFYKAAYNYAESIHAAGLPPETVREAFVIAGKALEAAEECNILYKNARSYWFTHCHDQKRGTIQ